MTPATACVYRAYAADGSLLYIGQSSNPDRRIATHRSSSPWASLAVRWDVTDPMPRDTALDEEAVAIYLEQPRHNVANKRQLDGVYARWQRDITEPQREALRLIGDRYMADTFGGGFADFRPISGAEWAVRVAAAAKAARDDRPDLTLEDARWAIDNWFGPPILARVREAYHEAGAA